MIISEIDREKVALFRFGIISALITGSTDATMSIHGYLKSIENREYIDPRSGRTVTFSCYTMETWYRNYRKFGFEGLKPAHRSDIGQSRKINDEISSSIGYYLREYPRLPATVIYQKLVETNIIDEEDLSLTTITREVNRQKKASNAEYSKKEMKRYEKDHINEVWCADTCVGPYITVNGEKRKTYIIGYIDDASRFIVGIDVFFEDNTINLISVTKSAVTKYGKPKLFNFDNGSNYKSHQMQMVAARIGVVINYNPPYTPTSKSKIERYWLTLKSHFLAAIKPSDYHSLDEFRADLMKYVQKYNQTVHSSIGMTPQDRFFKESEKIIRLNDNDIEKSFLFEDERTVSADSVIVLNKTEYEVDSIYRCTKLTVRYSPDLRKVYIVNKETGELTPISLLDKHANSKFKRKKIKFTEEN